MPRSFSRVFCFFVFVCVCYFVGFLFLICVGFVFLILVLVSDKCRLLFGHATQEVSFGIGLK